MLALIVLEAETKIRGWVFTLLIGAVPALGEHRECLPRLAGRKRHAGQTREEARPDPEGKECEPGKARLAALRPERQNFRREQQQANGQSAARDRPGSEKSACRQEHRRPRRRYPSGSGDGPDQAEPFRPRVTIASIRWVPPN